MKRCLSGAGLGLLIIALAAPFSIANERFTLWEDFGGEFATLPPSWVVDDVNSDGHAWTPWDFGGARGGCGLRHFTSSVQPADDWVFTGALNLTPAEACTLYFKTRVTSAGQPHKLAVWIGQTQNPAGMTTMLFSDQTLAFETPQDMALPFSVGSPGTYYVGFHCTSDPGMLALFLDQVGLAVPEPDLMATLQLDREIYDGSTIYAPGDPVKGMVLVANMGPSPVTINSKLTVGHEPDPNAVLSYLVNGPSGEVPFVMKVKPVEPEPGDFVTLNTGDRVHKYYDLSLGFDFTAPGDYFIEAVYWNPYPDGGGTAWIGRLVSTPAMITVEVPVGRAGE